MIDPHGIWFWTQGVQKAAVHLVNDRYRYRIHDLTTGRVIIEGTGSTLPAAKVAVFNYFSRQGVV